MSAPTQAPQHLPHDAGSVFLRWHFMVRKLTKENSLCFPKCHEKEPTHRLLATSCPSNFQPEPCAYWFPNLWINEEPLRNSMMTRCRPRYASFCKHWALVFSPWECSTWCIWSHWLVSTALAIMWSQKGHVPYSCSRYKCQSNKKRGIHSQMIDTYIDHLIFE